MQFRNPLRNKAPRSPQSQKLTSQQFKDLLRSIDTNGDGKITKRELAQLLSQLGMSFSSWKASRAMSHIKPREENCIKSGRELDALIQYAQQRWCWWPYEMSNRARLSYYQAAIVDMFMAHSEERELFKEWEALLIWYRVVFLVCRHRLPLEAA